MFARIVIPNSSSGIITLALIWLLMVIIVNPAGEFPLNDDWSYSRAVESLVEHGHLELTGFTSMPLIAQVSWGALFGLPFGFSFTALRVSTITLGLLGILTTYWLLVEMKTDRKIALLATMVVALNPLYFQLSLTFMTDVPFFTFSMLAFLFLLRALRTGSHADLMAGYALCLGAILIRQLAVVIPLSFLVAYLVKNSFCLRTLRNALIPAAAFVSFLFAYPAVLQQTIGLPALYDRSYEPIAEAAPTGLLQIPFIFADRLLVEISYLALFLLPVSVALGANIWQCYFRGSKQPHVRKPHNQSRIRLSPRSRRSGSSSTPTAGYLRAIYVWVLSGASAKSHVVANGPVRHGRHGADTAVGHYDWAKDSPDTPLRHLSVVTGSLLVAAILGLLLWRGRMLPLHGNVLFDVGLGPALLRDTYLLGLPHWPTAREELWHAVTAAAMLGSVLLIRHLWASVAGAIRMLKSGLKAEQAPIFFFLSAVVSYSVLIGVTGFLDRYLIWLLPLLVCVMAAQRDSLYQRAAVLVGGHHPSPQANGTRAQLLPFAVAVAFVSVLGLFALGGTHDYLAWNRARWEALTDLMEKDGISYKNIDGGFEFNGWYAYDDKYTPDPSKSWWWVESDNYVVSFGPMPGYVEMRRYQFERWIPFGEGNILVLHRAEEPTNREAAMR